MKRLAVIFFLFVIFVTGYDNLSVWMPAQSGQPNTLISFDNGQYKTTNSVVIGYLMSLPEYDNVYKLK